MKVKMQKKRRAPRASGERKKAAAPKAWSYTGATIAAGLDGYLVIWRHTMDDVPVGLFKTEQAALEAARNMRLQTGYACAKRVDIDCRTPVCFAVVPFKSGQPGSMRIVTRPDDA